MGEVLIVRTFYIKKVIEISAGHFLRGVPEGHPCANQHGHNYTVHVILKSKILDVNGFVVDFNDIKKLIKGKYDHKNLNDVMDGNPTAENIVDEIYKDVRSFLDNNGREYVGIRSVAVRETDTGYAETLYDD